MTPSIRNCLIVLGAVALAACSSKGKVKEPAELTDIGQPQVRSSVVWSGSPGTGPGRFATALRVAVQDDALFTADVDGRVFALNPGNGRNIWKTETKARVISGPAVVGDAVLVGTLDAAVIALARADGHELWRAQLTSEVMAPPVGDGDVIVAKTVDGRVYGLSADKGQRLWTFDRSVPTLSLRGLSPALVLGARVATGMDNGRVAMLRLADGKGVWEQAVAVPTGRSELERMTDVDGDLAASADRLYAVSFGGELAALDLTDGEVKWRRTVKSYSSLALTDDLVVATDEDGIVWALDARTGAASWKQEALRYRRVGAPVAFGGYFVVADFEGYLHWLDPKDGRIVGRDRPVSDPLIGAPVAAGELLYLQAQNGKLAALRAQPRS